MLAPGYCARRRTLQALDLLDIQWLCCWAHGHSLRCLFASGLRWEIWRLRQNDRRRRFLEKAVAPCRKGQGKVQVTVLSYRPSFTSPMAAFTRILQRTTFLNTQTPLTPFRNVFHTSCWQQKASVVQWGYSSKKLNVFESNSVIPEVPLSDTSQHMHLEHLRAKYPN